MMRRSLVKLLALAFACAVCAACAQEDADGAAGAKPDASVLVTTVTPLQQVFHATVDAWGSIVGDPQRARIVSLAYGGEVAAIEVAPGQAVQRGQVLLRIRPDPAVRSVYRQAQTALDLARSDLARITELASQQLATQSQLAAARKALADAETALAAQRAQGGAADVEAVAADAPGIVGTLAVHPGQRFAAGAALLDFTPAHALAATLGIQPEDGPHLRAGMAVELHRVYGAAGRGADGGLAGRLRVIGQAVDPQTHLLDAQVELLPTAAVAPAVGTAVSARIRTADFTAWAVPRDAVLDDDQGAYLYQVEQGKARRVAVRVRSPDGKTLGVEGALDARAPVIALGVYELEDGAAVHVQDVGAAATTVQRTPAAAASGMGRP